MSSENPLSFPSIARHTVLNSAISFAGHCAASLAYGVSNSSVQSIGHYFRDNAIPVTALGATTFLTGVVGLYLYNAKTNPYFDLKGLSSLSNYQHSSLVANQNKKVAKLLKQAKIIGASSAALVNLGAFVMTDNMPKSAHTYKKTTVEMVASPATQAHKNHIADFKR